MKKATIIRDTAIKGLSNEKDFNGMVTTEINGFHFSAADITVPYDDGNFQIYRIVIMPLIPQQGKSHFSVKPH